MSTNSYDSEPVGIRHFVLSPHDMPSCFLLELDRRVEDKAETVQMEDKVLSCLV